MDDSLLTRWTNRILDGERVWGALEFGADRRGFRSYRLIVYPPGIDQIERRYVRLARSWPVLGAALWLLSFVLLNGSYAPWPAVTAATLLYLGGALVVNALAGKARSQVRTLAVVRIAGYHDPAAKASYDELEALANRLIRADRARDDGRLTTTEHEAIWWDVYRQLDPDRLRSMSRT